MPLKTRLTEMFGIEYPIFAFTASREVAAAVTRAGGMGVFGAVAYSTEQLDEHLAWIDANTDGKPYGLDVVMPLAYEGKDEGGLTKEQFESLVPEKHRAWIESVLAKYKVPKMPEGHIAYESLLSWTYEVVRPQLDIALKYPIKLIANALGTPPDDVIRLAHEHGIKVAALSGSKQHALNHVKAGVDIPIAQGWEAGGHTGEVASMVLWPEVVDACKPTPVLAAGGIGTGRHMAAALALGCEGVWLGSVWLTADENKMMIPAVKEKLVRATSKDTVRSRAISGKPARQLRTAWTDAWEGEGSPGYLPLPLQWMATSDAVERIHHYAEDPNSNAKELLGSPVGQVVGLMNERLPAGEIVRRMVEECKEVLGRLGKLA